MCVRERAWVWCVCVWVFVCCNQQWNIARFLYYWHSPHCPAWGKVSFIPKGKRQTKSKSNKHNKTHWYSPGGHVIGLWRLRINQACHTDAYLFILRPHRRPSIHPFNTSQYWSLYQSQHMDLSAQNRWEMSFFWQSFVVSLKKIDDILFVIWTSTKLWIPASRSIAHSHTSEVFPTSDIFPNVLWGWWVY